MTTLIVGDKCIDIGTHENGARLFLEWSPTAVAWTVVGVTNDGEYEEYIIHADEEAETAQCLLGDIVAEREYGVEDFNVTEWLVKWEEYEPILFDLGPWGDDDNDPIIDYSAEEGDG